MEKSKLKCVEMNKKYTFKTSKRLFKIVTILMIKNKISNVTKL